MPAPEDLTIQRSTDLDLSADELWTLVSTAEGWASWLVDAADITITSGATGTTTVEEAERTVRIDSVLTGHRVSFSWWDRDGSDGPSSESYVQLDVVELADGRSRLQISEQLRPGPSATASATTASATSLRWDVAMVSLQLLTLQLLALHSLVMA